MAQIVPAILESDKQGFDSKVFTITRIPGVERIQVDFCDGKFVANKTIGIEDIDSLNPAFEWEAHLMIEQPDSFLDYKIAGFKTIILHYEAYASAITLEQAIDKIIEYGLKPAIAINPETEPDGLPHYSEKVRQFTLLSVHPGKQGAEFLPESIERLKKLRELLPNAILEVDGGVKTNRISELILAGADLLAVGSGLSETKDMAEAFLQLSQLAGQA